MSGVVCFKCGATSFNNPGKTKLACWDCYTKATDRAEKAEDKLLFEQMDKRELEELREYNAELLAMLEELEWIDVDYDFCPICGGNKVTSHATDCKLGNLLLRVRGEQ